MIIRRTTVTCNNFLLEDSSIRNIDNCPSFLSFAAIAKFSKEKDQPSWPLLAKRISTSMLTSSAVMTWITFCLLLLNHFCPAMAYRRVQKEKESDELLYIWFGHSLWSAIISRYDRPCANHSSRDRDIFFFMLSAGENPGIGENSVIKIKKNSHNLFF